MTTPIASTAQPQARASSTPPGLLDAQAVRREVGTILHAFVARKTAAARRQGLPVDAPQAVGEFLAAGGKRIRPLLCVLGWHAARDSDSGSPATAVRAGAALEMFHTFCMIHDDVMDHSDTRRGQPTVHRTLAARHRSDRTPAAADSLGTGAAILAGDLALIWSDELLTGRETGLSTAQRERLRPLIDVMRSEVMYGQYLDLLATGRPTADVEQALAVARYKTAKYTIERPLHIGAALAGADEQYLEQLSAFALPLGEAFQLRDDLLGVFGSPTDTGKPVLDDLREGKPTALIALALQRADVGQARLLRTLYGSPHLDEGGAAPLRAVIEATGADRAVETMIRDRYEQALSALQDAHLPRGVEDELKRLAKQAVWRTS
ncbi:polyprenyl synthetase family protein [Streptomyces cyaneus]|uniref:polyprenyl synthetase family protein n=1 Tax=Streptomyces cyaneus TaxID=1904 RepID=UPI000FF8AA50|nr:polyprenyl synthetase family protein [Streptomyces cyaneus]